MAEKVSCPKCGKTKVRVSRAVFHPDGRKNSHHPLIYFGLLTALSITITFRLVPEWQLPVGILCILVTVGVTAWLLITRRRLPAGHEYNCQYCEHQWFKRDDGLPARGD